MYRKCQLIYLFFLYILAFRFLSFFEKYFPSVAIIISCCFISCWWLGKANLENMFHFSQLFNFSRQRIIHEGFEVIYLSIFRYLSSPSTKVLFCSLFVRVLTGFTFHSLSLQFSSSKTSVSHLAVIYLYCSDDILKRLSVAIKFHIIDFFFSII